MGGGKSSTTTQSVSIPPEVMARYNAVNARAEQVASQPFQKYQGQFVAGLTGQQREGMQNVNQAANQAQSYYNTATNQLQNAYNQGYGQTQAAYQPLQQGYAQGQQYAGQAAQQYGQGYGAAQPYYQGATSTLEQGLEGAGAANQGAMTAAQAAPSAAQAANQFSQAQIFGAQQQSALANQAAMAQAMGATGASSPYYQAATQGIGAALASGQPYQGLATNAAMAGSRSVGPQGLDIGAYMSPYTQQVANTTLQALQQQQQQEMAGQTANAIRSGAFGGDRAGLAAANLARQQSLATAQAMAPIYQQGYAQALAAAQQQQGVGLSAAQADRAAQQQLAQQALAIGQQGYGQQMGAAQQQAALGQALFGQGVTGSQNLAQLGQTQYAQALGAGTAAGQLGQQLYGQGAQQAQLLSGLGQTAFGQNLAASQQQQALGQGLAGLGMQYGQALQGLGQQQFAQGQGMSAQQAALAQQGYGMGAGTAQAMAGLGTGAQAAALQGAQAQIAAGTLEQQTNQADMTARYQEFLQERGFPYQQAQFLANIAMGTGALSGSTTTTQQPTGFFSDERLKEDAEQIGKTNDGQPIYRFRYKGDPRYQIGLMAQEVAQDHPDAVGKHDGYLTVDYKAATDDAVEHRASGGVVPNWMGGAVDEPGYYADGGGVMPRQGYASGSTVQDSDFMRAILQSQLQSFGPFSGGGPYGGAGAGTPGDKSQGYVPKATLPVSKLVTASPVGGGGQRSGLDQAASTGRSIAELVKMGEQGYAKAKSFLSDDKKAPAKPTQGGTTVTKTEPAGAASGAPAKADAPSERAKPVSYESGKEGFQIPGGDQPDTGGVMPVDSMEDAGKMVRQVEPEDIFFASGGVVPRLGYAGLGKVIDPYEMQDPSKGVNAYIEDATEEAEDTSDDKLPGAGGSGGAGKARGVGDDIKDIAGLAGTAASAGKAIASLAALLPFSDERLKDNIEKVGKLNDGQNVYRYDFGNGRTQIGLLAQEVLSKKPEAVGKRDGYLTVDYDKATEGAIKRAMGGLTRQGYATEGEVEETPRYKIEPQNLEDMPEHRQAMLKAIYGPESGGRYDIRYGGVGSSGKTFDPEGPHPNIRERRDDGRYSTAAGAGQFIKGTWDAVTGGAPMTKGYQDAATWKLASDDYSRRTGRDLDADLQETGVTPEIKQALAPTWEAFAKQGRGGGKGVIPASDMPSEKATPVQYSGEDASSGFSIPGGSNFWVPALSVVGSMLASRNPTLGGAIGEGIVGGVAGYQAQQRLTADLAKNVLDIVRDRFNVTTDQKTGETRYFNKNTSELLTPAQFKQVVGGMARGLNVDPAVLGIVSPGQQQGGYTIPGGGGERTPMAPPPPGQGGAPAAAPGQTTAAPGAAQPGAAPTEEAKPVDLTRMNQTQLIDYAQKNPKAFAGLEGERDPNALQQQIANLAQREKNATNQGDTAEASRLAAERMEIQKLKDTYLREAVDLQYKTNIELTKAQTEGYNKYLEKAAGRAETYDTARSSLKRLADIYSSYEPNRAEELKTQVTDFLAGIGFNVFDRAYQNASFDEAMKTALTQAFKIVDENGLTRAPGAAMQNAVQTVPAPTLTAGGAYMLIGKALGELDYYKNKDQKFLEQPRGTQPAEFLLNYSKNYKDETPTNYTRKVFESEIRPGPGVTRQTIESARRSYGFERPAGSEPAPAAGGTQQQPATPAVPQVGAVQQGYRFLGGNPADPASWQKVQ